MSTIYGVTFNVTATAVQGHTPPGTLVVPGIGVDCELLSVRHVSGDFVTNADVTADYEIGGPDAVASVGGATPTAPDSDGNYLVVTWARPA